MQKNSIKNITKAVNDLMSKESGALFSGISQEFRIVNLYDSFKSLLSNDAVNQLERCITYNTIHEYVSIKPEHIDMINFLNVLKKTNIAGPEINNILHDSSYYERNLNAVKCIGATATLGKIDVAVRKICNILNKLADKDAISASLVDAKLQLLFLDRISKREKPKAIVLSYIALDEKKAETVLKRFSKYFVQEGEMPPRVN